MHKSLELLVAMIDEDKITTQEVLEAAGYKVETKYKDIIKKGCNIGYDEKIVAFKEFR